VTFPVERYGCERCGALPADHEPVELAAVGRVTSFAEVHRHHQPEPPTPFVVVAVDVDGGPALKGVLVDPSSPARRGIEVGARVQGHFGPDGAFRWARGA
jgi:uncharacterized OB-fold protein